MRYYIRETKENIWKTTYGMSSGTRSSTSKSKMDDTTTTIAITATEVEAIVQKVVSLAVTELKELFNNKLDRVASAESRILILEAERNTSTDQSHLVRKSEIMDELNNLRAESRETLLNANDNEQYKCKKLNSLNMVLEAKSHV